MNKIGIQAVDEAIKNVVDLYGTPIPQKSLSFTTRSWMKKIKEKEAESKSQWEIDVLKQVQSILIKKL